MFVSDNPTLLPSIFKNFGIPFGRNKETGAFFVPAMREGSATEQADHYAGVIASCDRAIAECAPTATLLIAGLNQMKTDAGKKSAAALRKDAAWQFAGPGSGEKNGGGPPPARRAKLAQKSAADQKLRASMKSK